MIKSMVSAGTLWVLAQSLCTAGNALVWRSNTAEDFDKHARDRFVVVEQEPAALRLASSWLAATEKGFEVKSHVNLSETVWTRKILDLPLAPAQAADLYIYRGGGTPDAPLRIEINGNEIKHTAPGESTARGWRRQTIPAGWLRGGRNELVMRGNGRIIADTGSVVTGSEVSYDGGENWHPAEGEFIVRLRLHDYAPRGEVVSTVIDAARVMAPERSIGPWPTPGSARLTIDAERPRGTAIETSWRAGRTPQFDPRQWSAWQTGGRIERLPGRYVQWRIRLTSRKPDRTPRVRSVSMEFSETDLPELPAWTEGLVVESIDRAPILESAYPFTYETFAPRVRYLREREQLERLLLPERDDLEHTGKIRNWAARRWNNGWDLGAYRYIPPWDALILLDMVPENLCLGMCTHYATVYVQASLAVGYLSRHVILNSHCVGETFLDDRAQWVIHDTGPGPGPDGYPVAKRFEIDGRTLSALELHRIINDERLPAVRAFPDPAAGKEPWHDEDGILQFRRFAIALRNDHLTNPEPSESEHGFAHYRYDGYLWWCNNPDDPSGKIAMYSKLSNRVADFYPEVNTTRIDLQTTREKGVLEAELYSLAPNFKAFEVNIGSAGWEQVPATVRWVLTEGENRLEARSRNKFGRSGPVASVTVVKP